MLCILATKSGGTKDIIPPTSKSGGTCPPRPPKLGPWLVTWLTTFREMRKWLRVFFLTKLNLKQIGKQNDSRGSGGMLPRKIFEHLHAVVGILALFEQFVTQIFFYCP